MADQHEDAVEKILAALNTATPPEGMELRIAQRLQSHAPAASAAVAAAWWRGALSGAVSATLLFGIVLLTHHRSAPILGSPRITPGAAVATTPPKPSTPVSPAQVHLSNSEPCGRPAVLRKRRITPPGTLMATATRESLSHSHPAPSEPLTAEEQGLLRLTHLAGPKQLAILNPEVQATLQAQEEADFTRFFTPPPRPKIEEPDPQNPQQNEKGDQP